MCTLNFIFDGYHLQKAYYNNYGEFLTQNVLYKITNELTGKIRPEGLEFDRLLGYFRG